MSQPLTGTAEYFMAAAPHPQGKSKFSPIDLTVLRREIQLLDEAGRGKTDYAKGVRSALALIELSNPRLEIPA